jgi:hypothetical protein
MPQCSAVYGCNNKECSLSYDGLKFVSFHKYPNKDKEKVRYKEWIIKSKRKNFTPTNYSVICSNHFAPSDLKTTGNKHSLLPNAVPKYNTHPLFTEQEKKKLR